MNTQNESFDSGNAVGSLSVFVIGAAIGAAAALIFAPASGRDTRAFLKRRGNELGRDAVDRGRETWRTQSDRVKTAVSSGWDKASDAINRARDEGKAAFEEARESQMPGEPSVVRTNYQGSRKIE